MEDTIAVLIPFGAFLMTFGIVYVARTASNRERLSMLDKGFTPKEIEDSRREKNSLSNGFFFVGGGFGVLVGYFLTTITPIDPILAYIASGFLFAGVGLVVAHLLNKKDRETIA